MEKNKENVIEWLEGDHIASVTLSQKRYISRVRKFVAEGREGFEILKENADGSIFAHVPISAVKISPKAEYNLTEEQKQAAKERLLGARNV